MSSVDVWCKGSGDEQMQDVIVEEDAVRFCRVTTEEGGGGGGPGSTGGGPITMDKDEKRMRREIANSNERRRMQSINAGFQSLRQMLPHHEGEKLSKAAILQQTAEYIYTLEQEKTRLLSQNCALKRDRERDQQDHTAEQQQQQTQTQTQIVPAAVTTVAKKRKIDAIVAVSDSSDEGLGSMSPEPVGLMQVVNGQTIVTAAAAGNGRITAAAASGPTISVSAKDYLELKHQLEVERRQKAIFEERLKALERQIYPARVLYPDVLEANEAIEEIAVAAAIPAKPVAKISREMENVQLITLDSGLLAKKQLVAVCSGGPEVIEETIVPISKTLNIVPLKEEKVFIKRSRSRSPTIEPVIPQQPQPLPQQQQTTVVTLPPKKNRFPTILEAAIKAEPKVEVERINSPSSIVVSDDHLHLTTNSSKLVTSQQQQQQTNSRINTCRHNLETIVEAIRHLEGDAFDSVAPVQQQQQLTISRPAAVAVQEVPLALTTSTKQKERDHRQSQLEPYLKFRTTPAAVAATAVTTSTPPSTATSASSSNPSGHPAIVSVSITPTLSPAAVTAVQQQQQTASQILQQHQQCRPGVIVVKQNS